MTRSFSPMTSEVICKRTFFVSRLAAGLFLFLLVFARYIGAGEVELTEGQFKKLDQFEAFALQKADKVFLTDKKQAAAEYDSFVLDMLCAGKHAVYSSRTKGMRR